MPALEPRDLHCPCRCSLTPPSNPCVDSNEALSAELAEEGSAPAVAAAKQRLWLIEESLTARMEAMLSTLRRVIGRDTGGAPTID